MEGLEMVKKIRDLIEDKLGEDVVCIDLRGISSVTDFFIIATGQADTHVRAITDNLINELKKQKIARPIGSEGLTTGTWACVDYGDAIVHIMRKAERDLYDLQSIWGAAPLV